ncbi:NnrS protein involved in response to NO [hydrothermal vent metagenome]|uniref:NnrS protein involved in response to NO n=1 Tax=hydrothermal vent metagenome TaxID=652676 RepID=A0A3B1BHY8_9ZZZZ
MYKDFTPFALGFRPFFICAGVGAVLLIALWICFLVGHLPANTYYGPIGWHSHEMLFGFTTAIIAGFLLTAVRNWTGMDTVTGTPLAALVGIWLLGRIMPFLPVPGGLIAIIDLSFLPLLAFSLRKPLMGGESTANRVFLVVLALATAANLLVHLQALHITSSSAIVGTGLMQYLIIWLLIIITGRVMPFFTRSAIPGAMPKNHHDIELISMVMLFWLAMIDVIIPIPWLAGIFAAILAVIHIIRVRRWYDQRIWNVPILWVLYTGYFWLIASFILKALSGAGLVSANLALHAFTIGTIGVFTLGMMSRVALGHTGRMMQSAKVMSMAYILLNLGALVRVLMPILAPQQYSLWIYLTSGIWLASFLIFCWIYVPILVKSRIDGAAG